MDLSLTSLTVGGCVELFYGSMIITWVCGLSNEGGMSSQCFNLDEHLYVDWNLTIKYKVMV